MSTDSQEWKRLKGSTVKFKHVDCKDQVFEGVIRTVTMGRILMELENNGDRYVWFLKKDIEIVNPLSTKA